MDISKVNKQRSVVMLFILLICSLVIISITQTQNKEDLVLMLRQNPISILFLFLPLFLCLFFLVKGNTKLALISFLKNYFLKYLSKFLSFIITSYIVFFVLIKHKNEDFIDFLIEILLLLTAFLLFLFSCWIEESANSPVNKENLKKFGSIIFRSFIITVLPVLLLFLLYHFIFSLDIVSSFVIGFLQGSIFLVSLNPFIKSKFKKLKLRVLL